MGSMLKKRSELRILLLQTRRTENVRVEERESFAEHAGLSIEQIDALDAFQNETFDSRCLDGYDALFVGGASEASVLEPDRYPLVRSGEALLRWCMDADFPVLASCFGFQMALVALGGTIVRDKKDFELGTLPIDLTGEAKNDIIFHDLPSRFPVVTGHKERAVDLPEGCLLLARTDICAHAFRYADRPFWATQFHPELDRQRFEERFSAYQDHYSEDDEQRQAVIAQLTETPESNSILRKFVDRVLLDGNADRE